MYNNETEQINVFIQVKYNNNNMQTREGIRSETML